MQLSPGKLLGMKRLSDDNGVFKMLAVDQRPPIKNLIIEKLSIDEAPWEKVSNFKKLLIETLQDLSTAILIDPHFAVPGSMDSILPRKGIIVTLEDSNYDENEYGRISKNIDEWSVSKIKRMGADAVKVLAYYRPDAHKSILDQQKDYIQKIGEQCKIFDILFLLELLVYPLDNDKFQTKEYIEMKGKNPTHVLDSVKEFSDPKYNVDVFKLESPVNPKTIQDKDINLFQELGQIAQIPWVMLSAGANKNDFKKVLEFAYESGCSGFLAGRAIWLDAFQNYPDIEKVKLELEKDGREYSKEISLQADKYAKPWHKHQSYNKEDVRFPFRDHNFRYNYKGIVLK